MSEKPQEEKENKSISKYEQSQDSNPDSLKDSTIQNQDLDDKNKQKKEPEEQLEGKSSLEDIIPAEILEDIPREEKQKIESSLSILMGGSRRSISPLTEQVNSEHIAQMIANTEKESQREFEKSKINETTKRLGMGAILSLVIVVFVYAGVTKDKDLSERVFLASISVLGGFGAGYAVGKDQ